VGRIDRPGETALFNTMKKHQPRMTLIAPALSQRPAAWLLAGALLLAASPAMALYKVVGPDGKVTYTDRPPTDQPSQAIKANGAVSSTDSLPFELRQVASRFPVTLYTSADCDPCDMGRRLLKGRGIPFTEKTVETEADAQALQRLEGAQQVPVLRIGKQPLRGYNDADWGSYLDAAGYPKQSALPRNYQYPAATPLVQAADSDANAASKAAAAKRPAARQAPTTPAANPSAPSGFRF
jgi:glutaredoxin